MKTFSKIIGWLLLIPIVGVVLLVASYFVLMWSISYEWNQKVTVMVETPEGIKSGSSVQHIEWIGGTSWGRPNGGNASSKTQGEAVVVDLGNGRVLFALLKGDGTSHMGQAATIAQFALCKSGEMSPGAVCFSKMHNAGSGLSADLKPGNLPMLVTFDDMNDPKTVKLVAPKNLAATFGEGFALKSISVAITDEKVAQGTVGNVLGWLPDYYDRRLDGDDLGSADAANKLANSLAAGAFNTVRQK
jgi:hypothetical protein